MQTKEKRCLIVYNPVSGKGINEKVLKEYHKILTERGYRVDFVATKYRTHATKTVEEADKYDLVFSIGGDGTLNEVVKGNYRRKERLTICPLPSGTTNDVATMLGYGKNPVENLNLALDGEVNDIDIGTINDSPFTYVVGMGKFMHIPYETSSLEKRKKGYIAYIKEAAIELFNKMRRYEAEVTADGVKLDGLYSLIMISNANHIAGINNFYKDICLNDGKMEVLLCKAKNKRELVMNFIKFLIGQQTDEIILIKAQEISVKMLDFPEKNWCIDGEKLDFVCDEYNIKINDKMDFLTPRKNSKKLFRKKSQ